MLPFYINQFTQKLERTILYNLQLQVINKYLLNFDANFMLYVISFQ